MTPPHIQSVGSVREKWLELQDKHHIVTIWKKKKKKKKKVKKCKALLVDFLRYVRIPT